MSGVVVFFRGVHVVNYLFLNVGSRKRLQSCKCDAIVQHFPLYLFLVPQTEGKSEKEALA